MPNFSVSCSNDETQIVRARGLSPSRVFQLGIAASALGGIDEIKQIQEKQIIYQEEIASLRKLRDGAQAKYDNVQEIRKKELAQLDAAWAQIDKLKKQLDAAGFMPEKPKVGP